MIFNTLEVRWFSAGKIPQAISDWFHSGQSIIQPARSDYYLIDTGPTLGVKLREGRLELKKRTADHAPISWGKISGKLECYQKWSFTLSQEEYDLLQLEHCPTWVEVHKQRWLRWFHLDQNKVVEARWGTMNTACSLELAQVQIQGQLWHTIALEGYGQQEELTTLLHSVGLEVFSGEGAPVLKLDTSYGYAQWLWYIETSMIHHHDRNTK